MQLSEKISYSYGDVDKVLKFGWKFKDAPGVLTYLNKNFLKVDQTYQRDSVSDTRIRNITRDWSWLACGTIIVAKRDDAYYVVDGQHRVTSALRRSDIQELPCLVFESQDRVTEAQAFMDVNTNRKAMSSLDKFKAALVAKDPTAIKLQGLLAKYNIRHHSKSNQNVCGVSSISTCLTMVEQNHDVFDKTLNICSRMCPDCYIHEKLMSSVYYLLTHVTNLDSKFEQRLISIGAARCVEGASRASSYFLRGGAKIWAIGVLEEINKGLRNRYSVVDAETD